MKRLLFLVTLCSACDAGPPSEPEASRVLLNVSDPHGIAGLAPLRQAVVWTLEGSLANPELVVTSDGLLVDLEASEVPLSLPDAAALERVTPVEVVDLLPDPKNDIELAYRPRFVVYRDLDGSADFDPALPEHPGPDQVLAVDPDASGVAALLDTEGAVRALRYEELDAYYRASGGHFTPFIAVIESSSLLSSTWSGVVSVELDDSSYPALSLACLRPTFATDFSGEQRVLLDLAVDPMLCGSFVASCSSTDLAELPPPELAPRDGPGLVRQAVCRAQGELQSLTVRESLPQCDGCACRHEVTVTAYVARADALPAFWPCGGELPFCEGDELSSLTPECE